MTAAPAKIDSQAAAKCVRLHRDEHMSTKAIARLMGVFPAAVYRAYIRMDYNPRLRAPQPRRSTKIDERLFPPEAKGAAPGYGASQATQKASEARRIADREPCTYCGVRGDIGCKHKPRP